MTHILLMGKELLVKRVVGENALDDTTRRQVSSD